MPKKRQTKAEKAIDSRIDRAFRATCCNIPISVLDISKVFAKGRAAIEAGADDATLGVALREFAETLSKREGMFGLR